MTTQAQEDSSKVVFITGAARRIGAEVARVLHAEGMNIALHYRQSEHDALALLDELHSKRPNSVLLLQAELLHILKINRMIEQIIKHFGRLDVLINNASSFYPTPIGQVEERHWEELIGTNVKAPFFLAQAAAPHLTATQGCIINMVDIHAQRPLKQHPVYCTAKAGLIMLTQSLAIELGPKVRVNAIAPGAILWPENPMDDIKKQRIISNIALRRHGEPNDIARTILFLIRDAGYITGQVIAVDGGRNLHQ